MVGTSGSACKSANVLTVKYSYRSRPFCLAEEVAILPSLGRSVNIINTAHSMKGKPDGPFRLVEAWGTGPRGTHGAPATFYALNCGDKAPQEQKRAPED